MTTSFASLRELLADLRRRPGLYLTAPTLECLDSFLSGWLLARVDDRADSADLKRFHRYLEERLKPPPGLSVYKMLVLSSPNTVEGFTRFFELFDQAMKADD